MFGQHVDRNFFSFSRWIQRVRDTAYAAVCGRQKESSVKTLRSPLSAEFFKALCVEWRNSIPGFSFVVRAKKMKILINNNLFPRMGFKPTTIALQSHPLAPAPRRP